MQKIGSYCAAAYEITGKGRELIVIGNVTVVLFDGRFMLAVADCSHSRAMTLAQQNIEQNGGEGYEVTTSKEC